MKELFYIAIINDFSQRLLSVRPRIIRELNKEEKQVLLLQWNIHRFMLAPRA